MHLLTKYTLGCKTIIRFMMVSVLLVGCASDHKNTNAPEATAKVGFVGLYDEFSCDQLLSEAARLASQMNRLAKNYGEDIDQNRMVFFGSIIYWPILLVTDNNADPTTIAQYNQLEMRMRVLSTEKDAKSCSDKITSQANLPDS